MQSHRITTVLLVCTLIALLLIQISPWKKGVAITYADCAPVAAVQAYWEYNWENNTAGCPGVENVPMIWGAANVTKPLGGNSQWLMGFNEPDLTSQADISPAFAAELWHQIEQLYPSRKLLAPAPSNNPDGFSTNPSWLADFRSAYISMYGGPPRMDGLAVHCYRQSASECITLTSQFGYTATLWNVPEVWVTEFSFSLTSPSNPKQAIREAHTFVNWMEGQPRVTRFAWFATKFQGTEIWADPRFYTPLVDWNTGQLSAFGNMYVPYR